MSNFNDVIKHLEEHEISFRIPMLSNKESEIEFRPMKVKDQKALVVNSSEESYQNQLKSLVTLVKSCIKKSPTQVEEMFLQDFIWVVLNIRMKSIGELIDISGICSKCGEKTPNLKLNLEKDLITKYLETIKDNVLDMGGGLKVYMTFPKVKHILSAKNEDLLLDLLIHEIDYIEFNDETIDLKDTERVKLLDGMNSTDLKAFETFEKNNDFGSVLQFTFNCGTCKEDNTVEIKENLLSFF